MFLTIEFAGIALAAMTSLAVYFMYLMRQSRSSKAVHQNEEAAVEEPILEGSEIVKKPSNEEAIETMLLAIASGVAILEVASTYGFTEDEVRVAMASYKI
jgi:hypothetical protein